MFLAILLVISCSKLKYIKADYKTDLKTNFTRNLNLEKNKILKKEDKSIWELWELFNEQHPAKAKLTKYVGIAGTVIGGFFLARKIFLAICLRIAKRFAISTIEETIKCLPNVNRTQPLTYLLVSCANAMFVYIPASRIYITDIAQNRQYFEEIFEKFKNNDITLGLKDFLICSIWVFIDKYFTFDNDIFHPLRVVGEILNIDEFSEFLTISKIILKNDKNIKEKWKPLILKRDLAIIYNTLESDKRPEYLKDLLKMNILDEDFFTFANSLKLEVQ